MSYPHAVSRAQAWYCTLTKREEDADLKKYDINTTAGADLTKSVGPSAEFLQMPIAFNYK